MKTLFTFLFLSILSLTTSAQWVDISPDVDEMLNDVFTINPEVVVVVGNNGTILKTTDGGETWQQKLSGTNESLWRVEFPTPEIGYITGDSGIILKSTDSGETWTPFNIENNYSFYGFDLSCVDENLLFASSNQGMIKSEDGGETWSEINTPEYSRNIQFLNENVGYAGTVLWEQDDWENPQFLKTLDGGISWQPVSGTAPFHFLDENTGYYYLGGLHKTTDGGVNFENLTYNNDEYYSLTDLYVVDENNIWGIIYLSLLDGDTSSRGIIKISSNDSEDFTEDIFYDSNPEFDLRSIHFAETTGYAVGAYGGWNGTELDYSSVIWKNGNGINMMKTKEENKNLFRVYPNPVSDEINIETNQTNNDEVKITITELSGKVVYSNSYHQNKITIDTNQFNQGIYLITVITNDNIQVQKIIIR